MRPISGHFKTFLISDLRRDVDKICALRGCYVASNANLFPDVLGQCIGPIFKGSLKMGPICCPETSVTYYHSTVGNTAEASSS
jgi:hypothetical protein